MGKPTALGHSDWVKRWAYVMKMTNPEPLNVDWPGWEGFRPVVGRGHSSAEEVGTYKYGETDPKGPCSSGFLSSHHLSNFFPL